MVRQEPMSYRHLWPALLIAGSVALSLGFACATPFAAFAALAALTLPRQQALATAGGVWLANQAVGFAFMHYPLTADCLGWAVALGAGVAVAAFAAHAVAGRVAAAGTIAAGLGGFAAAFAANQLFLLASALWLGGIEDFTPAIVARIFVINAATFVGLAAIGWLAGRTGILALPRRAFTLELRSPLRLS